MRLIKYYDHGQMFTHSLRLGAEVVDVGLIGGSVRCFTTHDAKSVAQPSHKL